MTRQIDFAGQSGQRYRYTALDDHRFLPPAGANFLVVRNGDKGASIVFAGETDSLANRTWMAPMEAAKKRYGPVEVLVRLNVTSAVRRNEQADLVAAHQPEMNVEAGAARS